MSLLDKITEYLNKEESLAESFREIFSKKRFKTDKEVTDWITHLTPGTIVDIDVVGPQSKKVLVKKGTKISSNKKGITGAYKTIHESEEDKFWFKDWKKWEKAARDVAVDDDGKYWAKYEGKLVAKWFPEREEGWVIKKVVSESEDFPKIKTREEWLKLCREYDYEISSNIPVGKDATAWKGDEKVGEWGSKENRGWIEVPVKRKTIHESADFLLEDRRADLNYKEKLVKGQIDRVTVELEAHESGAMTKLASRYFSIDKSVKKLMEIKEKMNAGVKERAEALFNAEDIVLTRVVETVSFGLTLSKQMQTAETTVEKVNYEKIAKELMALISEDLKPQVDAIIKEATTKTVIPASTKSPGLRITPKNEGFVGDAVNKFKELVLRFKNWARSYDKKLNNLKRML